MFGERAMADKPCVLDKYSVKIASGENAHFRETVEPKAEFRSPAEDKGYRAGASDGPRHEA
jgi:hypothetical protein